MYTIHLYTMLFQPYFVIQLCIALFRFDIILLKSFINGYNVASNLNNCLNKTNLDLLW